MSSNSRICKGLAVVTTLLGLGLSAPGAMADGHKVTICHKEVRTLNVARAALPAHMRHGDSLGECDDPAAEMRELSERAMLTCTVDVDTATHLVTASSVSTDATADITGVVFSELNCAEARVVLDEAGCKEEGVLGAADSQTFSFACPSAADDPLMDVML